MNLWIKAKGSTEWVETPFFGVQATIDRLKRHHKGIKESHFVEIERGKKRAMPLIFTCKDGTQFTFGVLQP